MTAQDDVTAVFGHRVRALRTARDWTLRDLGTASGVTFSTLSRIENGRGTTLASACLIAGALGVPLMALVPDVACGHCLDAPACGFTCQVCGTPGPAVTR